MDVFKLICLLNATVLAVESQLHKEFGSISCNPTREGTVTTLNINFCERFFRRFEVTNDNKKRIQFMCFHFKNTHVDCEDRYNISGVQTSWNYTEPSVSTEHLDRSTTEHPKIGKYLSMSFNIFNTTRETIHGLWSVRSYERFIILHTNCTVYENIENMTCSKVNTAETLDIDCMASNIHHSSKCIFHVNYTEPLYRNTIKLNESEISQVKEENILETNETYITRCSVRLRQFKVKGAKYDIAVTMYPVGNASVDYIQLGTTKMFTFKADFFPTDTVKEMSSSLTREGGANVSVAVGVTFGVISLVLFLVAMAIVARKYRVGIKIHKVRKSGKSSLELQQNKNHIYDNTTFEKESVYQNIKADDDESAYMNKVGSKLTGPTNQKEDFALEGTAEVGDSTYYEEMQIQV